MLAVGVVRAVGRAHVVGIGLGRLGDHVHGDPGDLGEHLGEGQARGARVAGGGGDGRGLAVDHLGTPAVAGHQGLDLGRVEHAVVGERAAQAVRAAVVAPQEEVDLAGAVDVLAGVDRLVVVEVDLLDPVLEQHGRAAVVRIEVGAAHALGGPGGLGAVGPGAGVVAVHLAGQAVEGRVRDALAVVGVDVAVVVRVQGPADGLGQGVVRGRVVEGRVAARQAGGHLVGRRGGLHAGQGVVQVGVEVHLVGRGVGEHRLVGQGAVVAGHVHAGHAQVALQIVQGDAGVLLHLQHPVLLDGGLEEVRVQVEHPRHDDRRDGEGHHELHQGEAPLGPLMGCRESHQRTSISRTTMWVTVWTVADPARRQSTRAVMVFMSACGVSGTIVYVRLISIPCV